MFGIDAKMPGMVYASIERPPVMGGKISSVDDSEARKVTGVSETVQIEPMKPPYGFQALGGVAVIADNTWAAMQGRKKLKVDWDLGANAGYDSGAFKKTLQDTARQAGQSRAQRRRCGRGVRQGRESSRSGILCADAGARADGASGGGGGI